MKIHVASFQVSEKFGIVVRSKDGRLFLCVDPNVPKWEEITPETTNTTDDRL